MATTQKTPGRKTRRRDPADEVEFIESLPPKTGGGTSWVQRLTPLLKRPGIWARIFVADNPELASNHQSNLSRRAVRIPEPDHEWSFAARGCEVYAVYRGTKPNTPRKKNSRQKG